jgi:hypothetical protein
MPAIAIFLGALVSVALTHKPSRPEFKFAPDLCAGAKGIRTPGPTRMRYVRKRRPLCRSPNAPVCDRDRDFESRFLQLGVCCELDFGRRAPMKASMWREPQRGPAISGNGVMCQGDPDVSRVLEADRSLPHQVEVYAASAQFGEIPPHHAEFGIELHPHRHHPIAAH